jgi:CDP-glucose 4,6-dehydratase
VFNNIYKGRRVLVTGHTGFKGSWLCALLHLLDAEVTGYSLDPPTKPNHHELLNLPIKSVINDIRDRRALKTAIEASKPEMVFHLAAQPIVRYSYTHPVETFETNVIGTVNLFEACRTSPSTRAVVNITSDKCYKNREWLWGYRENDSVGGHDPYSCSKACAELITESYRNAFFTPAQEGDTSGLLLASVRAGNVIGGGDWAEDRIIPDIVRSASAGKAVVIRNPDAVRPWQHVLEPLTGYLELGRMLLEGKREFAGAWNFGPDEKGCLSVKELIDGIQQVWSRVRFTTAGSEEPLHEMKFLKLDSSKARAMLKWRPVWTSGEGIEKTVRWYRSFYEKETVVTFDQIAEYFEMLRESRGC